LAPFNSLVDILRRRIPNLSPSDILKSSSVWPTKHEAHARAGRPEARMSNANSQSYLAKLSPWAAQGPLDAASGDLGLKQSQGSDHKVTNRHRLSLRNYPRDCPPLYPQWFFATDVPKRRPSPLEGSAKEAEKTRPAPKKYAPFSKTDSKSIEAAFRKIAEDEDASEQKQAEKDDEPTINTSSSSSPSQSRSQSDGMPNSSLEADSGTRPPGSITVPVNEDYLFDVDVERRELAPAYWLGPVYEVRRGTWFYQGKERRLSLPCVHQERIERLAWPPQLTFVQRAVCSGRVTRTWRPNSKTVI